MTITILCHQCNTDFSYEVSTIPQTKRKFCTVCVRLRKINYNNEYHQFKGNEKIKNNKYDMKIVFAYDECSQLL